MLNDIDDMPEVIRDEVVRWYYKDCLMSGGEERSQSRVFYGYDEKISPYSFYRVEMKCDFRDIIHLPDFYRDNLMPEAAPIQAANDNCQLDLFNDYNPE